MLTKQNNCYWKLKSSDLGFNLSYEKGKEVYTGTFDAGRKIVQTEGVRGLYRGFLVSTVQIVSGLCYGNSI